MAYVRRSIAAVLTLLVIMWSVQAAAQLANTPWPKPGKDLQNTSFGGSVPVAMPAVEWQVDLGGAGADNQGVIIDTLGNIVFKTGNRGAGSSVMSVNSGGIVWEVTDVGSWDWGTTVAASTAHTPADRLYCQDADWGGTGSNSLVAYDTSGNQLWALDLGAANDSTPTVAADGIIYCTAGSMLYCVQDNGASYTVLDTVALPDNNGVGPLALKDGASNDDVIFYTGLDTMVAVEQTSATTWTKKWETPMGTSWRHPAIGDDGNVYLSHFNDDVPFVPETLLCFDGSNGNVLWSVTTPPPPSHQEWTAGNHFSLLAFNAAQDKMYFGGQGGCVYCYNSANGSMNWSFPSPEGRDAEISASPSVIQDGSDTYIYAPSRDGWLYVLKDEGASASLFWSYKIADDVPGQVAVDSDGTIYVSSVSSVVIAFQPYPGGVAITNYDLPDGYPTVPYSAQLGAFGGVPPYTFSVVAGSLPPGLNLAADGAITGTPTATGAHPVTFQATDSDTVPVSGTKAFTMNIVVKIEPKDVPKNGGLDELYAAQLTGVGCTPPNTWLVIGGALPPGVNLNASTGLISGTPTTVGTYDFTIQVTDNLANVATEEYENVTITQLALDIATLSVRNGEKNVVYAGTTFEKLGGDGGTYSWSQPTGTIPPGLSLSAAGDDYVLSGTPTTAGEYVFSIQVTNGAERQINGYTVLIDDVIDGKSPFFPWKRVASDPATWPYMDTLFFNMWIEGDPEMNPYPACDNWPHKVWSAGTVSGNGKIYTLGGNSDFAVENDGGIVSIHGSGQQSHFSIYTPETDHWDSSYWKDWSVLAMQNGYAVNGMPTGINDPEDGWHGGKYGADAVGGTNKPQSGMGIGLTPHLAWAADYDQDGTDEVFLIGGWPNHDGHIWFYDPDTNGWERFDNHRPDGNLYGSAKDKDNLVYVYSGVQFDIFDMSTGTWTEKPDLDTAYDMMDHGGEIVGDKMVLFGGSKGTRQKTIIYDITADTWSISTSMIHQGYSPASCAWNGRIYVFGGSGHKLIQEFNPTTETWKVLMHETPYAMDRTEGDLVGNTFYLVCGNADGTRSNEVFAVDMFELTAGPPAVKPVITDVERGSSIIITWESVDTSTYRVESSTDSYDYNETNMTWTNEATGIVGHVGETSWTDTSPPSSGEKYYRVYTEDAGGDLVADDTVGMIISAIGLNRNMVSSPFEPYPPPNVIIFDLPLDTVESWFVVGGDMTATAMTENGDGFIRCQPLEDNAWPGGWFYFPSIRLSEASGGAYIDASAEGSTLEFDVRYYQEGEGAYDNANIGIQIISKNPDQGEMWLGGYFRVGASPPDDPPVGGEWYHLVIDLHQPVGDLDPQFIEKLELHGGYDRNVPEDYIDVKNLQIIVPRGDPGTATLDKIIGDQLTGHPVSQWAADQVASWDASAQTYVLAWLRAGQGWRAWNTMDDPPTFGFNADDGYWVTINNSATNLTLFGRVPKTGRTIPLLANRNMVGTCKPVSTTLAASDLVNDGFTGHPVSQWASDKLEFWNAAGQTYVGVWYRTGQGWRAWDDMNNPPAPPYDTLDSGEGFWLTVNNTPFTWTYPVP